MDSRIVAREIKNEIWPFLRKNGFTEFSSKTAWRRLTEQIHVVNFQSFNGYLAEGIGCTTFSFALNLGIYFRPIPVTYPVRKGPDPSVKPQEYHCHFRQKLIKGIKQSVLPRTDIWYVERDGSNLLEAVDDARTALQRDGLPWFQKFESLEGVLRLLLEDGSYRNSPTGKHMIGHIARSLGQKDLAEQMIAEAEREREAILSEIDSIVGRRRTRK